jgi:hypothetical protein
MWSHILRNISPSAVSWICGNFYGTFSMFARCYWEPCVQFWEHVLNFRYFNCCWFELAHKGFTLLYSHSTMSHLLFQGH